MYNFNGQVALITGASGAIGGAIAKQLHALGAFVILTGSNKERLENLASHLGNNYEIIVCDLSDKEARLNLIANIAKLDILVCNAGVTNDMLAIKMTDEIFSKVLNINLEANFLLNREAIKKMLKEGYGRIINISSIVAITGNAGQANYCASKAGLIGMSKSLALEVAKKAITINIIAPGFIETDMTAKLSEQQKDAIMQRIPSKKLGLPEDVAHATAFLASREAHYITGQTLHINGGMLMI